jgi:zinc transporter, ZIP family
MPLAGNGVCLRVLGLPACPPEHGRASLPGAGVPVSVPPVGEAFGWGIFAGSSLLLGGLIALRFTISGRLLGLVMAFGAGVLISAVAYELVGEAFDTSAGNGGVALGLFAGALTFFAGDTLIDRMGGADRKSSGGRQAAGAPLAIVLGIVLDGIPETAVIGLSLLEGSGVSVAVISAVFLSNLPESIAATSGLAKSGWKPQKILGMWVLVIAVCALASLAGYALLEDASGRTLAVVLAFAGGAVLTMLADTMMPEAFEHSGSATGLATTLGFALAFAISSLE